eukprot:3973001-Amphidinium_carterae.3
MTKENCWEYHCKQGSKCQICNLKSLPVNLASRCACLVPNGIALLPASTFWLDGTLEHPHTPACCTPTQFYFQPANFLLLCLKCYGERGFETIWKQEPVSIPKRSGESRSVAGDRAEWDILIATNSVVIGFWGGIGFRHGTTHALALRKVGPFPLRCTSYHCPILLGTKSRSLSRPRKLWRNESSAMDHKIAAETLDTSFTNQDHSDKN